MSAKFEPYHRKKCVKNLDGRQHFNGFVQEILKNRVTLDVNGSKGEFSKYILKQSERREQ